MSDLNYTLPLFVNTLTRYSTVFNMKAAGAATGSGSLTWVANDVVYVPISIPWPYPVARVFWVNGSVNTSSHSDFGIYTSSGTRIYSVGSTVEGTASLPQYTSVSTPFILDPGQYYFAFWNDNTTNRGYGLSGVGTSAGALVGLQTQAGQSACPATATFAAFSTNMVPLCGVTRTSTGF